MKKYKAVIFLSVIIVFSFIVRFYNVASLPPSLSPDEAALGYNAYSILKTGKDEHGIFLPISLQSFGDWKLPVYSYVDIPFIMVFGLTEFAVRFPSVIAGVLSVILIYFISRYIFRSQNISLIAALLLALSPWNIYFSRAAYEVNLGLCFFLAGLLAYLKYVFAKKNLWLMIVSALLFSLTLFVYHAYILFTPLFILALLSIYRKKVSVRHAFIFSLIMLFTVLFAFYNISHSGFNKISTLSIFNDAYVIYTRAEKLRGDGSKDNVILTHIIYNKYFAGSYQIAQNYLSTFSPSFLFDKGGEKTQHNLGYFGNLYLFDAILLIAGFAFLLMNKEKAALFLLVWVLIAPIPSSLTSDAQNSTRMYVILPVLILISAYGAYFLFLTLIKNSLYGKTAAVILLFLLVFNIVFFFDAYFVHMTMQRSRFWHYGYKQIALFAKKYPDKKIVFRGPENFPYIYFLFYNRYDSAAYMKEAVYYPPTNEGFYYVKSFDRFTFPVKIDYNNIQPNAIYIDDYPYKPNIKIPRNTIKLPSGEPIFIFKVL